MKNINGVLTFIFFIEEYLLWIPGQISTLIEKLGMVLFRSTESTDILTVILNINPAFCFFLLLISIGPTVEFFHTLFTEHARAEMIIWLERHKYVNVILSVIVVVIFLLQFFNIFNNPTMTLLTLYRNKALWTVIFGYIVLKRILSTDVWSQEG